MFAKNMGLLFFRAQNTTWRLNTPELIKKHAATYQYGHHSRIQQQDFSPVGKADSGESWFQTSSACPLYETHVMV